MKKILKLTGMIFGVLVLLLGLAIIFLVTFVSPNRFKPVLTEQVLKYTGRQLVIDGDMSWSFFPYLGVKVGHSTLSNPVGFKEKNFAEISSITMNVKLMPLFSKRIESDGVILDGVKLHLIKSKNGKTNWEFKSSVPAETHSTSDTTVAPVSNKKMAIGMMISGFDITNTAIDYSDEETNKYYNIKNFEMHAKDINLSKSFPIKSSFDFTANNPAASGHAVLSGDVSLYAAAAIYSFRDLNFSADIKQDTKKFNLTVSGNVIADLNKQTLQWTGFKAKLANITMTGKLDVSDLSTHPVTSAHLQLMPFDLKETLKSVGEDVSSLQTAKSVKGDLDVTADTNGVKMQGDLLVDTLQASKITISNIAVKAHFQKGILNLSPLSANLYQGNVTGQMMVNLNSSVPQITLHANLANVQAQPLMEDLGGKDQKIKIAGVGNLEMQVTTSGAESKALVKNLNGISQFNFKNGTILGVDLGYLVDSASALVKREPNTAKNTDQTNFGTLSGTGVIRSGVISNNDLFADTPRFSIHGSGDIDLVNQKINYALQTVVKQRSDQKNNALNLYGVTLPVLITGQLDNPSIRLDSGALVKAVAEKQIKAKLQEQIQKQLPGKAADLLKGKAGDVLNNLLGN